MVSESSDAITLKIEQMVVKNGVVKASSDVVTLPKAERPDIDDLGGVSSIGLTSGKTKIDLPSMAPPGSTLVFNDVQYFYLLHGTVALAAIATYFGVLPAVILGLVAAALNALADYGDFDPEDCYLDVWLVPEPHPLAPILIEVDYVYVYTETSFFVMILMIRNYLPLLWKLVLALAAVLLIANIYESVQSGHYDSFRQWLVIALLFASIIIRVISQKITKST